jgi:hypothetical protein
MTLQPLEVCEHLYGIPVTFRRIKLDGFLQHERELRSHTTDKFVVPGHRPVKWPLRQLPGKQPIQDKPDRKDI